MRTPCLILATSFLLGAALCAQAQTATTWNPAANPPGTGLWSESANWTGGVVPSSTNKVVFNVSGARACVVNSAVRAGQVVAGDNGDGGTLIITNGGSLTTSATNWCAIGYNNTNLMIVESGGAVGFGYQLWIGFTTGSDGTLLMNGGMVTVTNMIGLGWSGGKGTARINGGTLRLLQWDSANSIKGASVLDIGAGTVVITGNQLTSVASFIASGKITGYGGTGTVSNYYNGSTTTLTATPGSSPPVTNSTGILAIKLVNPNLVVSWSTSAVYYVLQSATSLTAPVVWKPVTNSVSTIGSTNQVTLTMSGQKLFFRLASGVDASTMNRKLLMGYQGWFAAPGDGSAKNSWVHWFGSNTPDAANAQFDFWPDTSELDADELFSTSMTYSNGSPAKLYSAYKQKTVVRHFKWMQDNNLDGVFFQRFLSDLSGTSLALRNQVATNVQVGAETYGRVFAIMYDISGYATNTLVSKLANDWLYLVNTQKVTNSSAYLRHKGKPVVAIWGFGFSGRLDTPEQAQQTIDWFKAAGCTVMGGLPTNWRTLTSDAQTNPAWSNVFRSFDVISPWSVGRYSSNGGADTFKNNYIVPDLADCTSHGIDYLPVIFPGFSWTNLNSGPFNQTPRNGGNFYWRQAYNAVQSGCTMVYGAMFDEVDEGTAMYKMAPTAAQLPAQGTFVPLNIDGYNLNSDWYLRLANQAGKMLRGEIPVTSTIPITPP